MAWRGRSDFLETAQTYTGGKAAEVTPLTDATNIATDLSLSNNFTVTLSGNRTLTTPQAKLLGKVDQSLSSKIRPEAELWLMAVTGILSAEQCQC